MFKKTKIAAAILAVAATSTAQAVHIDPNGTGQVLIFPYFNVNAGFQTSFNITNTTNTFKAVKIRFRESKDSNDVLDYNIYMSPYDQYAATVKMVGTTPSVTSSDKTCTHPSNPAAFAAGVPLRDAYANVDSTDLTEGYIEVIEMGTISDGTGWDGTGGAAEGGVEVASTTSSTVAYVPPVNPVNYLTPGALAAAPALIDNIPFGILHSSGTPNDCTVISRAFASGALTQGNITTGVGSDADTGGATYGAGTDTFNNGLNAPTGGLSGFSILLQASSGSTFVADALAIDNYSVTAQHFLSHDTFSYLLPSLASGDVLTASVYNEDGATAASLAVFGTLPLSRYDTGLIDFLNRDTGSGLPNQVFAGANPLAMGAALSTVAFSNDYFLDQTLKGSTDWVTTFPMKKHGVYNGLIATDDRDGAGSICAPGALAQGAADATGVRAHTSNLSPLFGGALCQTADAATTAAQMTLLGANVVGYAPLGGTGTTGDQGVRANFNHWDREETLATGPAATTDFSPPLSGTTDTSVRLKREVNVTAFNNSAGSVTSVLGTPTANLISFPVIKYTEGWGRLVFIGDGTTGGAYNYVANGTIQTAIAGGITTGLAGAALTAVSGDSLDGVPAIGFAAINGQSGDLGLGETIPHVRYPDSNPAAASVITAGASPIRIAP